MIVTFKRLTWNTLLIGIPLFLAFIFSYGRLASDHAVIFNLAEQYILLENSLYDFLLANENWYARHHNLWFLLQTLVIYTTNAITGADIGFFAEIVSSAGLSYAFLLTLLFALKFLKHSLQINSSLALATVIVVFLGSYGISFVSGGFIECILSLLIVVRLNIMQSLIRSEFRPFLILCIIDFALISFKLYSIFFIIACMPLTLSLKLHTRKQIFIYLVILSFTFLLQILIRNLGEDPTSNLLSNSFNLNAYITSIFNYFFSFSFGIIFTLPTIFLLYISYKQHNKLRRGIFVKTLAVLTIVFFTSLFDFWHGAGGIAGARYIFPYLLVFLPEIALGLKTSIEKWKYAPFLVPLLVILFVPVLEYRNTSSNAYALKNFDNLQVDHNQLFTHKSYPHYDPTFHPAVFAWKIVIAKLSHQKEIKASSETDLLLSTRSIYPSSAILRFAFSLDQDQNKMLERVGYSGDVNVKNKSHEVLGRLFKLEHETKALLSRLATTSYFLLISITLFAILFLALYIYKARRSCRHLACKLDLEKF